MSTKEVKSFRIDKEVVDAIKELKWYYSQQYNFSVSEAKVIESLVKEKLSQIKGEK
jgi:hypothetical protein